MGMGGYKGEWVGISGREWLQVGMGEQGLGQT